MRVNSRFKSPRDLGGANTISLTCFVDDVDGHFERARKAEREQTKADPFAPRAQSFLQQPQYTCHHDAVEGGPAGGNSSSRQKRWRCRS